MTARSHLHSTLLLLLFLGQFFSFIYSFFFFFFGKRRLVLRHLIIIENFTDLKCTFPGSKVKPMFSLIFFPFFLPFYPIDCFCGAQTATCIPGSSSNTSERKARKSTLLLVPISECQHRDLRVRASGCFGTSTGLLSPCAKLPWLALCTDPPLLLLPTAERDAYKFLALCLLKPDYKIGCGLTDSFMF